MNREDSYWYVDRTQPEAEQKIRAMCVQCFQSGGFGEHEAHERPWHWNGSKMGYGDYDLECSLCGHAIYVREKPDDAKETKTTVQS